MELYIYISLGIHYQGSHQDVKFGGGGGISLTLLKTRSPEALDALLDPLTDETNIALWMLAM